ncbi:hypothetical protein L211DRAFT_28783 [Terfezia boudieri ATCC MYA-4762]|uniref:Uncharacterized protein n=1 Tax=Terfezia boudieri ATCC MYA-4762 TaxID=1051890 RepID=A0A3N4M7L8_9PEZI|nr:hypothetical protein L211DRAFT_28783 [Terfezia boudieri ATCC MYA-4762]
MLLFGPKNRLRPFLQAGPATRLQATKLHYPSEECYPESWTSRAPCLQRDFSKSPITSKHLHSCHQLYSSICFFFLPEIKYLLELQQLCGNYVRTFKLKQSLTLKQRNTSPLPLSNEILVIFPVCPIRKLHSSRPIQSCLCHLYYNHKTTDPNIM